MAALAGTDWIPVGIDVNEPCAARVYDVHLGGLHNFAADRWVAQRDRLTLPDLPTILRAERAFLTRAVRLLIGAGVRQFLDLGCGLPTDGAVHQIADDVEPQCRVLYVDVDPVAVAHGARILAGNPNTGIVCADLRDVPIVLAAAPVRDLIDFSQPVAVLLVSVLQCLNDRDDPAGTVARYRDAVPVGSYLVISHPAASGPARTGHLAHGTGGLRAPITALAGRSRDQIEAMFAGWDLVEPGLTVLGRWRPDRHAPPAEDLGDLAPLAGVACKG